MRLQHHLHAIIWILWHVVYIKRTEVLITESVIHSIGVMILRIPSEQVGTYATQVFSGGEFISVFGQYFWNDSTYMTLAGRNTHHIIEATFKAFTRALRQATEYDPRGCGNVPRFVFCSLVKKV
ncbi:imidazoleglycerol-phosphate dehydratase [Orobanche hederae]